MGVVHRLINRFLRRRWTGQWAVKPCSHLDQLHDVEPLSDVCEQCVELGETWPGLRVCMTCGHVGCCEDTEYQHAYRHFEETGHPLVRPLNEFGMDWIWCYVDKTLLDRE